MSAILLPGRALPVLHDVDAAVVGGTLAGTAAAVELARAGRRVVLLEHGYALGTELTAANRPWLTVPADGPGAAGPLAELLPPDAEPGAHVPLRPAALKLCLEDALLGAGGALLYGVDALAPHTVGGERRGLVVSDVSGRQLVRCPVVLDATGPRRPALPGGGGQRAVWSVEFEGVTTIDPVLDPVAGGIRLVAGCRGPGHLYALLATEGGRLAAVTEAGRLLRDHPAFARARLGAVGSEPLAGADAAPIRHPGEPLCDAVAAWGWGAALAGRGGAAGAVGEAGRGARPRPAPRSVPPGVPPGVASVRRPGEALFDAVAASRSAPPGVVSAGAVAVAEQDGPARGRCHARERVAALPVPCLGPFDVLVVGGGSSGASAALAAAGAAARTLLADAAPGPGGTGTYGGVHSYWFGRREGHAAELQRLVRRTHRELGLPGGVGAWTIEAKALALHRELSGAGVDVRYDVTAFAALREENRVVGAVFNGPGGPFAVTADVTVDATGDAHLAAWCGAPCTTGAAGVHTTMWASLARFDTASTTRNSFGGLADPTDVTDTTRAVLAARRRGPEVHDHGVRPAARESRHLVGEVVVTLTDQLTHRRWPDTVNLHFSNHDLKGKGEALWPQVGLIPPNLEIELPYRALLPRGLDGLLVTGKALSATHDALPALRMQADLENLGEATGIAAARCAAGGVRPRDLDVAALQRLLVRRGRLPAAVARRATRAPAAPAEAPSTEALIAELAERLPLYGYSDMGRREVFTGPIPFVELALDPRPATTGALLAAAGRATGPARLALAQLLVLRGRREGADVLLAHCAARLAGDRLPPRTSRIREAQLPPDQSAMPDEAYLLHTLAVARDPRTVALWDRVALLLDAGERAFHDPSAAPFAWVDAVCAGAERLGDPAAVPALERIHDRPALHGQSVTRGVEPDDTQERRALLELALGRALAACGSPRGHDVLVAYLADTRALLAEQAHSRLTALTGADHGKDRRAWARCLAERGAFPRPPTTTAGGATPSSTRSTCAVTPTGTGTGSATSPAPPRGSGTSRTSAPTRSGSPRSTPRRRRTAATTSRTTATSTRAWAPSPTPTRSWPAPTAWA